MPHTEPHLRLLADHNAPRTAMLLRAAGYAVSTINHAAMAEPEPLDDGLIVELPALATISIVRRIAARRRDVPIVVISADAESVRRALPWVRVIRPEDVDDDLVSAVDLALAAKLLRRTG
jgi:CheY-like chemotaxis protein